MADVDVQSSGGKGAPKAATKRTSTKIDMTPMVDLAFLLITFFMLTTTLNKPQTMEITMPDKNKNKEDVMKVKESRTLTLLLGEKDRVYYYQGVTDEDPDVGVTNFGAEGVRKLLMEKKAQIGKVMNPKTKKMEEGIIVLIKARETSRYKNIVDILDEMNITGINTYAVVDITEPDLDLIRKTNELSGQPQE